MISAFVSSGASPRGDNSQGRGNGMLADRDVVRAVKSAMERILTVRSLLGCSGRAWRTGPLVAFLS